jgi:hypothetical protein
MTRHFGLIRAALLALPALLLFASVAAAETQGTTPQMYGGAPGSMVENLNEFYNIDIDTAVTNSTLAMSVPGRTITGLNSVTVDPTTGTLYGVIKAASVSGRLLITLDPTTGIGVEVGNLGDNFSSLAFRADGQLFGLTGDGAAVPETLYLIDKANATKVVARTLGNGADGEVFAYNPYDKHFYHWSGNIAQVYERVQSVAPYAVTNIPITGATNGEVFGAVWDCRNNEFVVSNIISRLQTFSPDGTAGAPYGATLSDEVRGLALVMPPESCDLIFVDGFQA